MKQRVTPDTLCPTAVPTCVVDCKAKGQQGLQVLVLARLRLRLQDLSALALSSPILKAHYYWNHYYNYNYWYSYLLATN